jgi:hypothetical protein
MNVIMLNVIMLNVSMLNVSMLSVIMLSVVTPNASITTTINIRFASGQRNIELFFCVLTGILTE